MADNVTVNEGTAKAIAADDVSSVWFQKIKLDIGGDGVSSPFTGTLADVTNIANLAKGTVTEVGSVTAIGVIHTAGTVSALPDLPGGTIDEVTLLKAGTVQVNPKSPTQIVNASALGTAGAAAFGTLSTASGAGTYHNATGLQIVVSSGTVDAYLGFGTAITGADVLARGQFTEGGGIARDFSSAIRSSGTNSEICYKLGGAGTVFFAVNYWEST